MNIKQLMELKINYEAKYNEEFAKINNLNHYQHNIYDEELKDIKKEIDKIDSLLEVYKKDNIDFRIMKLEQIYIMQIFELNQQQYRELNIDEKSDYFNKVFPSSWVIINDKEKKEKLLLNAILLNSVIDIKD